MAKPAETSKLKQLMRAQLRSRTEVKVDSPYAKYNSRGQLSCIVCNIPIKNKIVWQAHINKSSHLQKLSNLQQAQQKVNSGILKKTHSALNRGAKRKIDEINPPTVNVGRGVDIKVTERGASEESEPSQASVATNSLPEGFFDDPVADAKARQVEYVDKQEEQYEEYLKAIADDDSDRIFAEDREQAAHITQMQIVDEQIELYQKFLDRVASLEHTKQQKPSSQVKVEQDDCSDSSDSEPDFTLDWRCKNPFTKKKPFLSS